MNFPIGMNPMMRYFIIPGVNMSIDLGQFMCELMHFRGGNAYDKAFLHQAVSLVVDHSMTVYFINALNFFMMAYGLAPSYHLSALEFDHIYNHFNDSTTETTSSESNIMVNQPIEFVEEDVCDEMKHRLDEVIDLIPKIPSEKLDLALSLVLKKTYAMDKKIRDRMYGEITDVKARVNELKMNRQQVQEQEDATRKVRIFLGRE